MNLTTRREVHLKTIVLLRNAIGTAGLLFAGYLLIQAIPELKRYAKISMM
jgi:hypothetical protein